MTRTYNAIVLAGGAARRMGGIDKATVKIGGRTLLERALEAVSGAEQIVCVGPPRETSTPVIWAQEHPAGGGPVPAIDAGLRHVTSRTVVVLGVDTPFVTGDVVDQLVEARGTKDAAVVQDNEKVQPLIGAYATGPLRSRLKYLRELDGVPMMRVIEGMSCHVIDIPHVAFDCDTWDDVERAARWVEIKDGRLVAARRDRARRRATGRR